MMFSVFVSLPFLFTHSNRIKFYFSIPVRYVNGNSATEQQCVNMDYKNGYE